MGSGAAKRALSGAAILAVWAGAVLAAPCNPDVALFRLPSGGEARFSVEIADDAAERAQGLMGRKHLASGAGMLFVYESEHEVAFWMRNTLIPLDMVFINGSGQVISVHDSAKPHDETPIRSGGPVQMVLEINGGLAHRIGLQPGSVLAHPALDPALALLPCD